MKLLKRFLLFLSLTLILQAATVTVTFNYNFGTPAFRQCSGTITTNCLDHFEVGFLAGSTLTTLGNIPIPAGASGSVSGITGSASTGNVFGAQTISVVMVAKDATGGRVTSDPTQATSAVFVPPPAPSGLSAIIAP